jgi:hypothetical protein
MLLHAYPFGINSTGTNSQDRDFPGGIGFSPMRPGFSANGQKMVAK